MSTKADDDLSTKVMRIQYARLKASEYADEFISGCKTAFPPLQPLFDSLKESVAAAWKAGYLHRLEQEIDE